MSKLKIFLKDKVISLGLGSLLFLLFIGHGNFDKGFIVLIIISLSVVFGLSYYFNRSFMNSLLTAVFWIVLMPLLYLLMAVAFAFKGVWGAA